MGNSKSRVIKEPRLPHFRQFNKLPGEVQFVVWKYVVAAEQGVVEILGGQYPNSNLLSVRRIGGTPVTLHLCQWSRIAAQQVYRNAFSAIDGRGVWFNFDRDILDTQNAGQNRWYSRYPKIAADLALVRNVTMRDLSDNYTRLSFGPPLKPYANLRVLRLSRNAAVLTWKMGTSRRAHDSDVREALKLFWRINMPTRSVPLLIFLEDETTLLQEGIQLLTIGNKASCRRPLYDEYPLH